MITRRAALIAPAALLAAAADRPDAGPMPLSRAMAIAEARYRGRAVDGSLERGRRGEPTLVYHIVLRTEAGAILRIRLDAETGDFLEVTGRGQIEALR